MREWYWLGPGADGDAEGADEREGAGEEEREDYGPEGLDAELVSRNRL